IFYDQYEAIAPQYDKVFKVDSMNKASETDLGMGAFQTWTERVNDTDNVIYQKIGQGLERTYIPKEFSSGFAIGKRLHEDELYGVINKMPADLAEAGRTKVENDASAVLNDAFADTTIYDGQFLVDTDHPYEGGLAGTQSNLVEGALG